MKVKNTKNSGNFRCAFSQAEIVIKYSYKCLSVYIAKHNRNHYF